MSKNQTPQEDFRRFVWVIWRHLNLPDPTPTQYEIAHYLQHGPDRLVVEAFRGVGKSWLTAAFVCWKLLNDPQLNILVVSASSDRARDFTNFCLRLIREVEMLKPLIPEDHQRQSSQSFDVGGAPATQMPSLKAMGITSALTGSRADLIVADDIEVANNSDTQSKRDKLSEQVKEFSAILKPGGHIVYLGTPQSEQSVYNSLPDRGFWFRVWPARFPEGAQRKAYVIRKPTDEGLVDENPESYDSLASRIKKDCEQNGGNPTDPHRFPERELVKRELDYGRSGFALQFMLDTSLSDREKYPLKIKDLVFENLPKDNGPESVTWTNNPDYMWKDLPNVGLKGDVMCRSMVKTDNPPAYRKWEGTVMAIDPSGRRGKDETAYAIGSGIGPLVFLRDTGGYGGGDSGYSDEVLTALARKCVEYDVELILIEENFGQGMFSQLLKPVLAEHKVNATINEIRSNRQKELRICDTLEPLMNRHQLVVDKDLVRRDYDSTLKRPADEQNHYRLFWQIARMTRERGALPQDDRVDVLAMMVGHYIERMALSVDESVRQREAEEWERELDEFVHGAYSGPNQQQSSSGDGSRTPRKRLFGSPDLTGVD